MNFEDIYSKKVLEHVRNPRNMGEIKNPDGVATVGNRRCGDIMKLYIKIKNNIISDIKFQTLGCGAAIATSSIITTMVKGKPISKAEKITNAAIVKTLGGLPKNKIHCSLLGAEALHKAIGNYREKFKNVSKTAK